MRTVQFINPCLEIQNDLQIHQNVNNFIDGNSECSAQEYSDLRFSFAKEGFNRNEGRPRLLTTATKNI